MADMITSPATPGLTPQIWDDTFFREYVRSNRFMKYMGRDPGSMIQVNNDLTTRKGDTMTFAAMRKLVGAGVTGNTMLEGNEEILDTRSMKLSVLPIRHAVAVTDWDEQRSAIDLRNAVRPVLKDWAMEKLRNDIITGLISVNGAPLVPTPVAPVAATAGQQNTWLAQNYDRALFGHLVSNNAGNVMATSLANITLANDTLTPSVVALAKRMAKTAKPAIRPITIDGDRETFVLFAGSMAFRDFKNSPAYQSILQYAAARGPTNPLFQDGDLMYDDVVIREIPEYPVLVGAGAGGINVAVCTLMGAQALGMAWAQRVKTQTNVRDYGFRSGVGIQEIRGIGKLCFGRAGASDTTNLVDQGMVTLFVSGVPDA